MPISAVRSRWSRLCTAAAVVSLALCGTAGGAQNIVQNPSFEAPSGVGSFVTYSAGSTAMSPWVVASGTIDQVGTAWTSASGSQSLDMNGSDAGSIYQDLTTSAGATYNLSFALAGNPGGGPTIKHLQVLWNGSSLGTYTFDVTGHSSSSMGWIQVPINALVATGGTTRLQFTSLDPGSAYGPALDTVNVQLAATPEPGTLTLLFAVGGAGALVVRRRA